LVFFSTLNNLHIEVSLEDNQSPLLWYGKRDDDRSDKKKKGWEKKMRGQRQGDRHKKRIMESKTE